MTSSLTDYEQERKLKIEKNKAKLEALGLASPLALDKKRTPVKRPREDTKQPMQGVRAKRRRKLDYVVLSKGHRRRSQRIETKRSREGLSVLAKLILVRFL